MLLNPAFRRQFDITPVSTALQTACAFLLNRHAPTRMTLEDLSKRRAEAVRGVLVAQFNVDPTRLTSAGFGAANPIGNNDIPDGRLANRRVEFIKK